MTSLQDFLDAPEPVDEPLPTASVACPCDWEVSGSEGFVLDALEVHERSCRLRPVPEVTTTVGWPGWTVLAVTVRGWG